MKKKVHLIAAARPNFMKIAPLYHALVKHAPWAEPVIVHTGQHYDANMSENFFRDLNLNVPRKNLEVGSGSHAEQTGGVMIAYEKLCVQDKPDAIVVVGDVNSTLACSIVAKKLVLPLAHLEAGLRSGDKTMPEEINRILTDSISDILWTPSPDADENLRAEGRPADAIVRVGNIMMDSYEMVRSLIESSKEVEQLRVDKGEYVVATLHRPSNVDQPAVLAELVEKLIAVARFYKVVFVVHPRTRGNLTKFDLLASLERDPNIQLVEPLSYIPFMALVKDAACIVTDSGGVQEETTYLGIPCLTLRRTTERPITVSEGTNRLVKPQELLTALEQIRQGNKPKGSKPQLWDGHAAERIVQSMKQWLHA